MQESPFELLFKIYMKQKLLDNTNYNKLLDNHVCYKTFIIQGIYS